jgi:hypothetical protein
LQRFSKNFEWDRPYILDTEKNAFLNGRDVSGRHGTTWVCSKTQGFSNDLVGIWKCILLTLDALGNLFRISDNDVEWSDGHFEGKQVSRNNWLRVGAKIEVTKQKTMDLCHWSDYIEKMWILHCMKWKWKYTAVDIFKIYF